VLRVHYRPPESLPPHHRDFPAREAVPDHMPDHLHMRDTRFLWLMVAGYLLTMLGGIILLQAISPVTRTMIHSTETADVQVIRK
jgi:hypothetical protein